MGTALIGVLLLLGVFWGLTDSIESSGFAGNMSTTEIQDSLFNYVETMQTTPPQDIPSSLVPQVTQIVDSTISSAMKMTFNVLALIFLLGFFTSLFLPRRKIKGSFKGS